MGNEVKVDPKPAEPATLEEAKTQIAVLANALRFERMKTAVLVDEAVAAETAQAEADLAPYANRLSAETREFVRGQLIENRVAALTLLRELVPDVKVEVPVSTRQPLHNRSTARPVAPVVVGGGGARGAGEDARAAKVRNRAQELVRTERLSFSAAFSRAESEFGASV